MGTITLDYTTIAACDSESELFTTVGTVNAIRASDYVEREGTDCLDWGAATGGPHGQVSPTVTGFSMIDNEIGVWFLLPKGDSDVNQFLYDYGVASPGPGAGRHSLRLRVYGVGGTNWAEYDQGSDDTLAGGWVYLRCSGGPGTEDGNSGTWNLSDAQSVTRVAIIVYNLNANNQTGKNETARYGMDWFKYYTKITVDGYVTGTTPYDMEDVYSEAEETKPYWGVMEKTDIFYKLKCGLQLGNTAAGALTVENRYLFFDQFAANFDYDITVKNNFVATFGKKDVGTDGTYAVNGCQIINNIGTPDIVVESGGELNLYACRVQGWNTINLGSGGTGDIEIIKTDFFDNVTLELRTTGLTMLDVRMHFPDGSEAAIGVLYSIPTSAELIKVFQCTDGLVFRAAATVEKYIAGDNTYDAVVLEGTTINLVDSSFASNKLKRIAA